MARAQLGDIFLGITPAAVRQYMRKAFKLALEDGYQRVIVPCAGRFTIAEAAVDAGWSPTQIETSDVSLFSSVLGYSCAGKPLDDLGITFQAHLEGLNAYQGRLAGAVLFGLKVSQLRGTLHHERLVLEELWRDANGYIDALQARVTALSERLKGCKYEIRDVREHCASVASDHDAVVYVNPPGFSATGYTKMFDTHGGIAWREHSVPPYDPKTGRPELYRMLMQAPALAYIFRSQAVEAGYQEHAVFAVERSGRDFVLCNRPDEAKLVVKTSAPMKIAPLPIPLLPHDHVITKDAKISFLSIQKGAALYYRDLFAHKLPTTRSEFYFAALLDGHLFAVFGMFLSEQHCAGRPIVFETFGFTAPNKRYPRINHLFMASIVSQDAKRLFQEARERCGGMQPLEGFQTTCISVTPEQKSHRSTGLKLIEKETMPDGRFKLVYAGGFRPEDLAGTVSTWLARMANVEKETGKPMGVTLVPAGLKAAA